MVDIKDVPRDVALPWLALLTDGESMRRRLQPHFGAGLQLLQVKVGRLTYKPGRNARFAYRIKLLDRERGTKARHVMHGRMEPLPGFDSLRRKLGRRPWSAPRYGPAFLAFEDIGVVLWGFPNDPKLPGLERVAEPENLLGLARGNPALAALQPTECQSAVVKYVPGKRLVMKHRLTTASGKRILLYSKTYSHGRGEAIHAVVQALWERSRIDAEALACPEPLAWMPATSTLLLGALPGMAAIDAVGGETFEHDVARAGAGLARIHASPVAHLERTEPDTELESLHKAARFLVRHDPGLEPSVAALLSRAAAARPSGADRPWAPIHGAFRFTQLLKYRDRLALVDFDGFALGHPMSDVGSFVAHLLYLYAKGEVPVDECRRAIAAFLSAYRAAAPWGTPEPELRWYTAVLLVAKHAQKCVKRLKDDGDTKIRCLVDLATDIQEGRLRLG